MKINSKQAFSLVPVLIAATLIAFLGMALSRMLTGGFKGQKTIQVNYEINTFKDEVRTLLKDPDACKNTFGGLKPWPVSNAPLTVTALKTKLNATRFQVGQKYGDNALQLDSIKLGAFSQDPATSLVGFATLTLGIKKLGSTLGSSAVITKTFNLNVSLRGGAVPATATEIVGCSVDGSDGGEGVNKNWVLAAIDDAVGGAACFETTGSCDGTYYIQAATHTKYNCVAMQLVTTTSGASSDVLQFESLNPCGPPSTIHNGGVYTAPTSTASGALVTTGAGAYSMTMEGSARQIIGSTTTVKVCCKKPPAL